jgi:hypothetical protein
MSDEQKSGWRTGVGDSLTTVPLEQKIDYQLKTMTTKPLQGKIEGITPIQTDSNSNGGGSQSGTSQSDSGKK